MADTGQDAAKAAQATELQRKALQQAIDVLEKARNDVMEMAEEAIEDADA